MKIRKSFLLPALLFGLISCNAGGGTPDPSTYTITFSGTNCFLKNSDGDEITSPVTVNAGVSLTYTVFVKNTEQYDLPTSITITDGVDYKYTSKTGELSINNVSKDIKISARAADRTLCNIYYLMKHSEEGCSWSGPEVVEPNNPIVATATIASSYTLTQENITVVTSEEGILTEGYSYEPTTHKLVIESEHVCVGIIGIIGYPQGGQPGPTTSYKISFNMPHADATFPEKQELGESVEGIITATDGYRCPTKEEMIDNQWLVKIAPSSIYHFKDNEFMYIPYTNEYGASCAYLYIDTYYLTRTTPAQEVQINGDAFELVTVTFDPGDGKWTEGEEKALKSAEIDKGIQTLTDAAAKCGANITPVYGEEGYHFGGWYDEASGEFPPTTQPIESDLDVVATYQKNTYMVTNDIKNATVTNLPELVEYHEGIGLNEMKPVVITPNDKCVLPAKEDVKVLAKDGTTYTKEIDFTYDIQSDGSAKFSIAEGIIEADIRISLSATEMLNISFDPNGGTWQVPPTPSTLSGTEVLTTTVPVGSTYQDAYDTLPIIEGSWPLKDGLPPDSWACGGQTIDFSHLIDRDGMTIVAVYSGTTNNFSTDTWANVIDHANKGELVTTYGSTLYLGATRYLNYKGNKYQVRVIDSEYDRYYDGKEYKKTSLTFEFADIIDEGIYGDIGSPYPHNHNNWENSKIRSNMGDIYQTVVTENSGFVAKPVIKHTLQGADGQPTPVADIYTTDYFFPLSGAEIGIAYSNGETNECHYDDGQRSNEGLGTYVYYQNHNRLKKKFGAASYSEYWLRSPHVYKEEPDPTNPYDTGGAYFIRDNNGQSTDFGGLPIAGGGAGDYIYGYAPAFCI